MASTYLTRTPSSTGNRKKWTWSGWVKKTRVGGSLNKELMAANNGSNQFSLITFTTTDQLSYYDYTTGYSSHLITNRLFRDTSAWLHIVVAYDSAQSTSSNRIKFYVNGVQETSFGTSTYPSQNYDSFMNLSGLPHYIGREAGTSNLYEGSMTHIHFCDGYAYDASSFGESDSTSGIWKPKTSPSVTYGSNGFFLKFENSGAMGTDSSGNSNTFSVGNGTLTQNVDTPTNNFATGNPLVMNPSYTGTFSNGNNKLVTSAGGKEILVSSLAVSSGKWYAEYKADAVGGGTMIGVIPYEVVVNTLRQNNYLGQDNGSVSMLNTTGAVYNPPTASGITGVSYTSGDIIGVAVDLDNSYCYFHKNGTYINSGNPASGASGTGGVPFTKGDSFWCFAGGDSTDAGGSVATISANFGSGYFGTTQVASANADANGHGAMEYPVPSGFYSLNTKNIKEFG
jgi:hypothetical protein